MRARNHNRGAILLKIVFILTAIVIAGIITFLTIGTSRYRSVNYRAERIQARAWAESGMADALNRLRHDPFWRADGTETFPAIQEVFDGGGHRVLTTVLISPNHITIEAEGSADNHKQSLRQEAILEIPALFSLIAREDVRLYGQTTIDGSVSSGKTVTMSGNARINGAVQVRERFNGATESVADTIYENLPQTTFPELDLSFYDLRKASRVFGGAVSNLTLSDTMFYIAGSVDLAGLDLRNGTLFVDGDLRITGPCRIEGTKGRIAVIVTGNLTIEERGNFFLKGPCYVFRDFKCRGKGNVEGTVIAQNIEITSEFRIRPQLEAVYGPIDGLQRHVRCGRFREGS